MTISDGAIAVLTLVFIIATAFVLPNLATKADAQTICKKETSSSLDIIIKRLDRVESKLDRLIERNMK